MATFVKISNGTVAQFNVLFIFVMAWCWFNATNLSRETLAETQERHETHKKETKKSKKNKNKKRFC